MKKVVALIAMLSLAFFASCTNEETTVETGTGVEANVEVTGEEATEEEAMEEEATEEEAMTDTEGNEVDEEAMEASLEADAALEVLSEGEEEMAK